MTLTYDRFSLLDMTHSFYCCYLRDLFLVHSVLRPFSNLHLQELTLSAGNLMGFNSTQYNNYIAVCIYLVGLTRRGTSVVSRGLA